MGRIEEVFRALRERGERALMPFLSAGDPTLEATQALVLAMDAAGADVIEIGVPFSDPLAEGPTIQRSSERGLASGASLRRVLELVARLRARTETPLVLMGYANPYLAMGAKSFAAAAREVGVDGVIVPDLPLEEGEDFYGACRAEGVATILMAAPTTRSERLAELVRQTHGFLYYVSLAGVTGARAELSHGIEERVREAKALGDVPVCVGFGVSRPEHAAEIGRYADGVVVGSAIVERIEAAADRDAAIDSVSTFVKELKAPLRPS